MAEQNADDTGSGSPNTERDLLRAHLTGARDAMTWKVEGLTEEQRRRPMTPTGTNLIGLVKHLTWIEGWYLCEFFDRERPRLDWEWEQDADWGHHSHLYAKPEETTEDLLAAYRATTAAADRSIDELGLDAIGTHWSGESVSLRSMVLAVLVDTVRHAGHGDIVRELIDGATGDRNAPSGFYGVTDEDYRTTYLARVRGEIDTPAWWDYITRRGKRWG
ncbi:MAG: DinB family protein [Actinomycetota bacterium]